MRAYGNLINRVMEGYASPAPVVGMGATMTMYSDRHAGTVVEIIPGKRPVLVVQRDKAKRIDANGMSDCQNWAYEPDPEGPKTLFRQNERGVWKQVYENPRTGRLVMRSDGCGLVLGERDEYYDFSF